MAGRLNLAAIGGKYDGEIGLQRRKPPRRNCLHRTILLKSVSSKRRKVARTVLSLISCLIETEQTSVPPLSVQGDARKFTASLIDNQHVAQRIKHHLSWSP
jgi:hypothetical protein